MNAVLAYGGKLIPVLESFICERQQEHWLFTVVERRTKFSSMRTNLL